MQKDTANRIVLLVLVVFITFVFLEMIKSFLMVILMAGIFAALFYPLFQRLSRWFGDRRVLASLTTLVVILFVIIIPLGLLVGIITGQALKIGQEVSPWVSQQLAQPDVLTERLQSLAIYETIAPYRDVIIEKAGKFVGTVSNFLINSLSAATTGTVSFLFHLFIFLYTMFFFLLDGNKLLRLILYYLPLEDEAEARMLERFTSVTRATLKGTAVIGLIQGGLAGLAFFVIGIDGALFWGTIMAVLSIIPGVGTALIWVPAAIILVFEGRLGMAIGLTLWCAVVVGSVDNLLRPRLVGKDTKMHDLLILFSTLGGIFLFGIAGFIIGPIIAALLVTVWEIYGQVFSDILPTVHGWRPDQADDATESGKAGEASDGGASP